jgi:branched-chain amino acid transport system ATP-binding protein
MLEVRDLEVYYGTLKVLEKVTMHVGERELVAIIGANGAGKSTLLKAISHMIQSSKGSIHFMGKDVTHITAYQMIRSGASLVPEGRQLFESLTVLENLEMGAYIRYYPWGSERKGKGAVIQDMERVYDLFKVLKERRGQKAGTLSGGEQQMLAIGRALMSSPKLLLIDEPSLGLSPRMKEAIFETFRLLRERGLALLLVEQDVTSSLTMADRAYVMESGIIKLGGKGLELLENEEVKQHYLGGKYEPLGSRNERSLN